MYVAAAFIFQQGITRVSQVALVGKNLPASSETQEIQVQSLG